MADNTAALDTAAQDPALPAPPEGSFQCERGEWNDLPSDRLLETIAYDNCANWTGDLDWCKGASSLNTPLAAITTGFADNFVLKCLAAPEQVKLKREGDRRSQYYTEFGPRCAKIREIVADHDIVIKPDAVTGARLFAIAESNARVLEPEEMLLPNVLFNRDPALGIPKGDQMYWQYFKIATPDADMQAVIDMIRSGVFSRHGLYLNDFDVTIDCRGAVRMPDLVKYLLNSGTWFRMQGDAGYDSDDDEPSPHSTKTILDNKHKVGNNCVTWLVEMGGNRVRVKLYLKLVQEFEKQSVRSSVGQHIPDWIEMMDTRLAGARDATVVHGLCRSESSLYVDGLHIPIPAAHLHIPATAAGMTLYAQQQLDVVPPHLVLQAPHALMVANWVANIKQTLVVVDTLYNAGLVVYTKNDVTHTVSGTLVKSWKRRSKYVLQKLMLGDHPVDVVYLNRGSAHKPVDQQMPGAVSRKEKAGAASKQRQRAKSKRHAWVDRDADGTPQRSVIEMLGTKRVLDETPADSGESESESEAEEEEEEELDAAAQVAAALAKERRQHALEIEAAQVAACADSTSTLGANDAAQWGAPAGGLVVVARRYHRIATSVETPNVTEFPPSGGLEHYFHLPDALMPVLAPLIAEPKTIKDRMTNHETTAANKKLIAQACGGFVETMVATAGFRPLARMNTIRVQPRVAPTAISNKINHAHLVEASIAPVIDLNSLLSAKRMMAFNTKVAKLALAKEKLRKKRNDERLASLALAADERESVSGQKAKTDASIALKTLLKTQYNGQKARSLRNLAPGAHPLVAVRLDNKSYELFLSIDDKIMPFNTNQALEGALKQHALQLAPLYNDLGDGENDLHRAGTFYLDPALNRTPIGVLTNYATALKEVSGRLMVDCSLVVQGETLVRSRAEQRQLDALAAPMDVEAPVAPLSLSADEQRGANTPYLDEAFSLVKGGLMPRVVRVLKTCVARNNGAHCESAWREVEEDAFVGGLPGPVLVRGGPTLNHRLDEITQDCRIVVYKSLAKHALNCKIVPANEFTWMDRLPVKYDLIPALRKGRIGGQPATITIAAVGSMTIRGADNPVIVGEDGRPWRFQSPQNVKPNPAKKQVGLRLDVGSVLNVVSFTVAPCATVGAGCSTDPLPP